MPNDDLDIDHAISNAHLNAAGWSLQEYQAGTPIESHMFYVKDCRTGLLWLCGVAPDAVEDAMRQPRDFSTEDLVGVIAETVRRMSPQEGNHGTMSALPDMLCHYLSRTQTYMLWRQQFPPGARMHALLLIYGGSGDWVNLRPVIMHPRPGVVPREEVEQACDQVAAMDRQNHPEWFS
jgi:hypothetical protein